VTLSGIELATFWFVAQCLNHYATTPYAAVYYTVLLMMGIMMPET
jgi:hypothetical protein